MSFFDELRFATGAEAQALLAVPQIADGLSGRISHETYVAYLREAYHHVKHTVPLMRAARARLGAGHKTFIKALEDYEAEEIGHDQWILDDIHACGADAEAARASEPRLATELMVVYAYDYVSRINPMGFFGMVFVLESTSVLLATRGAGAVQRALALPPSAFRYLNSHGALDQEHMAYFKRLMNEVKSSADKAAIVHVAKAIFILFGNVFHAIPHQMEASHAA